MTIYRNSTLAFLGDAASILSKGRPVWPRGKKTLERLDVTITLALPRERCYVMKHRNNNIFAQIAETLWMLRGRDDIEWLSYYLPRAPQFSDNGRTWRGAYGPRLRNWNGADGKVDQLEYVINAIKADRLTRQAVISIWDASIDCQPGKDIPCNNWLHFIQREGRLIMNVAQRSSDILWGYSGIDTFSWSVLLEMMAYWTGCEPGTFTHFITSLHLYEEHYDRVAKILKDWEGTTIYGYGMKPIPFSTDFDIFDQSLEMVFAYEKRSRDRNTEGLWEEICDAFDDEFLGACTQMLHIYSMMLKVQELPDLVRDVMIRQVIDKVRWLPAESDFRIAALEYIHRAMGWNIWDLLEEEERWLLAKYVDFNGKNNLAP